MNVVDAIREAIDRHGLVPAGARVVAGVSGGADSVALLRALHRLEIPCTVAHLNHRLRGAEADADERFVRDLAAALGLPAVVGAADVGRLAAEGGVSIEMAARQARHAFFAEFRGATVALAHQADDQAETFLLRLARGAGSDGLAGMSPAQQVGPVRLVRPMLGIPGAELRRWLEQNGYAWREDASNADESILRNRVRHTILPMLERELNPAIRAAILRAMDILREEQAWMDAILADRQPPPGGWPRAARRRALRKWLFENGAADIGFDAVERILALVEAGEGTTVCELNNRQRVVVEYGTPRFERAGPGPDRPGWILATGHGTGWRKDHGRGAGILPAEASFSAAKVGGSPVAVRGCEPGDRIAPLGMEGSRKLQDILTDQKVPRHRRPHIPVVVCRGEIIWVPGYRIARGWEVPDKNAAALHVRLDGAGRT